jgi:hypothetical protein
MVVACSANLKQLFCPLKKCSRKWHALTLMTCKQLSLISGFCRLIVDVFYFYGSISMSLAYKPITVEKTKVGNSQFYFF